MVRIRYDALLNILEFEIFIKKEISMNNFENFKQKNLDLLKIYISEQKSISEISRLFELNCDTLRRYLKKLNIDYHGDKNNSYDINCYLNNEVKISASSLRKKLIDNGLKEEKCECCGLTEWLGNKIPLELHHINGNHNDNSFENLEILCSNCHSIKHGYSMVKKICKHCGNEFYTNVKQQKFCSISCKTKHNKDYGERHCEYCGKTFYGFSKRKYCSTKCAHDANINNNVTKDELVEQFKKLKTFVSVSKHYGVSDKAVYKWCKKLGLPITAKEMKKFLISIDN